MQLRSSASACPVPVGTMTCFGSTIPFPNLSWRRFIARLVLLGAERIGESRGSAAGTQRARLRLVWRPGGQRGDLEFRRDAPLLVTETRAIDFGCTQHRRAAREMAVAQRGGVGLAHRTQIAHELPGVGIVHGDAVAIDDRQRETGT